MMYTIKPDVRKSFILKNSGEAFEKQKEVLTWMRSFEQVDDVCVVGFEL